SPPGWGGGRLTKFYLREVVMTPADVIQDILSAVTTIFPNFQTFIVAVVLLGLAAVTLRRFRVLGR
ncbi:MAG: hypothetical protein QXI60_08180, partial [Thermofilaceae archaeon]